MIARRAPLIIAIALVVARTAAAAPPSAPQLDSPAPDALVPTLTPTLRVVNAIDPDGDSLRYRFEVFYDPALSIFAASSPPAVAEGAGDRTSWQVDVALLEDRFCYWRVVACDPTECGPSSAVRWFGVTAAPGDPEDELGCQGCAADGGEPSAALLALATLGLVRRRRA